VPEPAAGIRPRSASRAPGLRAGSGRRLRRSRGATSGGGTGGGASGKVRGLPLCAPPAPGARAWSSRRPSGRCRSRRRATDGWRPELAGCAKRQPRAWAARKGHGCPVRAAYRAGPPLARLQRQAFGRGHRAERRGRLNDGGEMRAFRAARIPSARWRSRRRAGGWHYLAKRRTLKEIGSPTTTMCTTKPKIRS
jgi:hypothetical protein